MSKPMALRSATARGSPSIQVPPDSAWGEPLKVRRSATVVSKLPNATSAPRRIFSMSGERFSIAASMGRR
jgi:hypothetical protein